jgi:hypothetical protein
MISLICSNCSNAISVDDGFAGGVCRCVHCGAIQTVPEKGSARADQPASGGKTLYQRPSNAGADQLGQLSRAASSARSATSQATPSPTRSPALLGAVAVVVLGMIAAGVYIATRGTSSNPSPHSTAGSGQTSVSSNRPSFGAIPLTGPTVVYMLDRGDATAEFLPQLLRASAGSARSLGAGMRFQIILWTSNGDSPAFPEAGPKPATLDNIASALQQASTQSGAARATTLLPALDRALGEYPSEIIIATGKGASLEDDFATDVLARVHAKESGSRRIKLHTIDLQRNTADEPPSAVLQKLASETESVHLQLDAPMLEAIAR